MIEVLGLVAAVALPFWNIPLIRKIQQRQSSQDISFAWAVGVYVCLWGMVPAALVSTDIVFKVFSIVNVVLFTAVIVQVLRFRNGVKR